MRTFLVPSLSSLQLGYGDQTTGEKVVSGGIDGLITVGIYAFIGWIIYKSVKAYKKGKREGKSK